MYSDSDVMEPLEKAKFIIRNSNESQYLSAYNILVKESKKNSPEADYYLGLIYARGHRVSGRTTTRRGHGSREASTADIPVAPIIWA